MVLSFRSSASAIRLTVPLKIRPARASIFTLAGSPTLQNGTSGSGTCTIVRNLSVVATVSKGSEFPSVAERMNAP